MTPPHFVRYNKLLCIPGKGEYSMCVARTRNGGRCSNFSVTLGSLCNMHMHILQKYKRLTTHYYINICKGCCSIPTLNKLCIECSKKYCIIGDCCNLIVPDTQKCFYHQPRCNICKTISQVKLGNKYFCREHCGQCIHCNKFIEIESYRLGEQMCKDCLSIKCLHKDCSILIKDKQIQYCDRHLPPCSIENCTERTVFCYNGISKCSTHRPHCYNCSSDITQKNIRHIILHKTDVDIESYRYYCCYPLPICQYCTSRAHYEYDDKLFKSLCVIHNNKCGFPGCSACTTQFGHYCYMHWINIEFLCVIIKENLHKKQLSSSLMSFIRCSGRTRMIKFELYNIVSMWQN